jgi:hypothetical protein
MLNFRECMPSVKPGEVGLPKLGYLDERASIFHYLFGRGHIVLQSCIEVVQRSGTAFSCSLEYPQIWQIENENSACIDQHLIGSSFSIENIGDVKFISFLRCSMRSKICPADHSQHPRQQPPSMSSVEMESLSGIAIVSPCSRSSNLRCAVDEKLVSGFTAHSFV